MQDILTSVSSVLFLNRMLKDLAKPFQKFEPPTPKELLARILMLCSNAKHWTQVEPATIF